MITSNITLIRADFAAMSSMIMARSKTAITKAAIDIQSDIMIASPVGRTGHFRSDWAHSPTEMSDTSATAEVYNTLVYAEVLEQGSQRGELPWKKVGPRTNESNGRIWSSQAIGGVMKQTIDDDYINTITGQISNFIFHGFELARWRP